jgi:hypothetical protein
MGEDMLSLMCPRLSGRIVQEAMDLGLEVGGHGEIGRWSLKQWLMGGVEDGRAARRGRGNTYEEGDTTRKLLSCGQKL